MAERAVHVLLFLAASSIQVAVLSGVAVLLLSLVRGRPAVRHGVLVLVAMLPVLSLTVRIAPPSTPVEFAVPAPSFQPGPVIASAGPAETHRETAPRDTTTGAGAPVTGRMTTPSDHGSEWRAAVVVLAAVWLAVSTLLIARVAVAWLVLHRRLRHPGTRCDGDLAGLAARCADVVGLRRTPRLSVHETATVPFATGIVRPHVVLPTHLLAPQRANGLRFALLHEFVHIRRRDHLMVVPELLLRAMYFFHPLLRWALRRLGEEREHLCDREVVRLTGRRASYAEFLLGEIRSAKPGRQAPVLALRHGTGSASRRVRRLIEERGPEMSGTSRVVLFVAVVALATIGLLSVGPVLAVAGDDPVPAAEKPKLDNINANPTEEAGVYHVMPVFKQLAEVRIFKRKGPYGREHTRFPAAGTEWEFAPATGMLRIRVPVDDETEMVSVTGVRVMPWAWRATGPLKAGTVRVLLGDRAGVRGQDFETDEAAGTFRFLKAELCDAKKDYYICYDLVATGHTGSIGNHRDRTAVRRFLGLPPRTPPAKRDQPSAPAKRASPRSEFVGTGPWNTDDPRVFQLSQRMASDSIAVSARRNGKLEKLERGLDYSYDEVTGKIVLLRDVGLAEGARPFVYGTPVERHVVRFVGAIEAGSVKVVVGDRRLKDSEFTVDHAAGVVTVHDPAIREIGVTFYVGAGSKSFGTFGDMARLRELLKD